MKVYLAAMSACYKDNLDLVIENKCPFLESFVSFKDWELQLVKTHDFLLDSGAFTFMSSSKSHVNWDDYIVRYAEFIKKNNIKHFFELDIDSVAGYDKVKEYRRTLEKLVGRQCIPVWHKSRGPKEWLKMCDEYKYVAIGGIVSNEIKKAQYVAFPSMIGEAHRRGAIVHGLGFTSTLDLQKYHFDSVDSTNWLYGRYGHYYVRYGGYMKCCKRPDAKRGIQDKLQRHNLSLWIEFQKYAETRL